VTSCGPHAPNRTATTCSPVRRPGRTVLPVVLSSTPVLGLLGLLALLVLALIGASLSPPDVPGGWAGVPRPEGGGFTPPP